MAIALVVTILAATGGVSVADVGDETVGIGARVVGFGLIVVAMAIGARDRHRTGPAGSR